MKTNKSMRKLLMLGLMAVIIGGLNAMVVKRVAGQTPGAKIPDGEKVKKHRGIVSKRSGEMFLMGDTTDSAQTVVIITPETKVKSHKKGIFRGSKNYE